MACQVRLDMKSMEVPLDIEAVACMSPLKTLCTTFFPATLATGVSSGLPGFAHAQHIESIRQTPFWRSNIEHLDWNGTMMNRPILLKDFSKTLSLDQWKQDKHASNHHYFLSVLPPLSTFCFCLRAPVLHQVADGKNVWHLIRSGQGHVADGESSRLWHERRIKHE